ncbi:hypothetical protein DP939_11920 [Spongiactinospora rosea]|uniref:Uncharacterized protein n=1 Tax=Spongiactinospora rosea TaxID=2248750 RepID=A0A366M4F0_9ACTN|nr:hypothetical protein [Spongiactinospora rosea]RBQ20474.1 hypothetical protein DP939_11920 [Spongiactinospora rosea]
MAEPTGPAESGFDAWGVVVLVMHELSRRGVKARFEGHEMGDARQAAHDLLTAFGIAPAALPD